MRAAVRRAKHRAHCNGAQQHSMCPCMLVPASTAHFLLCTSLQIPQTVTQGAELPLNALSELVRAECAMAGFSEILTWCVLCCATPEGAAPCPCPCRRRGWPKLRCLAGRQQPRYCRSFQLAALRIARTLASIVTQEVVCTPRLRADDDDRFYNALIPGPALSQRHPYPLPILAVGVPWSN